MLECALAAGLCSMGADACLCGVLPTPGVAAIAAKLGACAGIVVSASQSLTRITAIKVFDGNGFKLSESVERVLEERILKGIATRRAFSFACCRALRCHYGCPGLLWRFSR